MSSHGPCAILKTKKQLNGERAVIKTKKSFYGQFIWKTATF